MSLPGNRTVSREVSIIPFIREGKGITEEDCESSVKEEHQRLTNCDRLEKLIGQVWKCALMNNPNMCNRMKFRLHGLDGVKKVEKPKPPPPEEGEEEPPPEEEEEDQGPPKIGFKLGITYCREYLGTNCLPYLHDVQQLQVMGQRNYCNRGAYLAHPLGVGVMVLTEDKKYVFIRRLNDCCESRRLIDIAVGIPDPLKIVLPLNEHDLANATSEDLVAEIFAAAIRAVEEELGIPAATLSETELLGVVVNNTKGERPRAIFAMNCELQVHAVVQLYNKGRHPGWFRTSGVLFTPEQEVKETPIQHSMFFKGLAPGAKGAMLLLREQVEMLKQIERENNRKKPE